MALPTRVTFLLLTAFYSSLTFAQDKLQISAGAGYQQENFHWSIAGNTSGQNPNVYSELKWKAVAGPEWNAAFQWNIRNKFFLLGDYRHSSITSGTSNDTDYSGDDRTGAVYNQDFRSNKGNTTAWSTGVGYVVYKTRTISLAPCIGYGGNYQTYYLLESSAGLNTSYKTHWQGTFIKLQSQLQLIRGVKLAADITYNQVKYNAAADWNLITSFQHPVSFRHAANGYGFDADAKVIWSLNKHFSINTGAAYFNWQTGKGTDQLYLATGETDNTQLNGVFRNGFRIGTGLTVYFNTLRQKK